MVVSVLANQSMVQRVIGNTKSLCTEHGEFEDVIPFGAYNAIHRDAIEKKFSKPREEKYGNKGS